MSLRIGKHVAKSLASVSSSDKFFNIKGSSSSGEILINKDDLIAALTRLRDNEYVPIKKLNGSLKSDFDMVVKYVNLVHPTNTYPMLKSLIDQYFYDIESITPGTIGAYFSGWNLNVNLDPKECAAAVAGGIPPDSSDYKICKNNVILAERTDTGYDFTVLTQGEDRSHTYLYVKNVNNYDDFDGFTDGEKRKLKKYGVEHVNLYGYENANEYTNLTNNVVHLDEVKCRNKDRKHSDKSDSNSGWLLGLFIFIVLIIIILCIACYPSSGKPSGHYVGDGHAHASY